MADEKALGKYEIAGDVPVLEVAGKLLALHPTTNKAGEPRFAMTEVVPSRMKGREVAAWTGVFDGVRLTFYTPVEAETFFRHGINALDALKVKPRMEAPLPSGD